MLRKLYRPKVKPHWDILEKDTVDEIIFRTTKPRNRLMLELMARGAMRIGEVLKLTPSDIVERKVLLREPKSGREAEMIFIPQSDIRICQRHRFIWERSATRRLSNGLKPYTAKLKGVNPVTWIYPYGCD